MILRYLGMTILNTEMDMAGKTISMSDFKQAILLKQQGMSNRRIAQLLGINKETVNNKFAFIRNAGLSPDALLKLDDPELEKVFHGGWMHRSIIIQSKGEKTTHPFRSIPTKMG